MENLPLSLPQFAQELLLTSGLASYLAALLNQPKFPAWLKLVVVFAVACVAAAIQEAMHPHEGVDRWARVGMVFFSAVLLYNNLLKGLGADWLTNKVTPESIGNLIQFLTPTKFSPPPTDIETSPAAVAAQALREKLRALDTLKDVLTEVEYKARRAAIIHGGQTEEAP